jgi:hypothetical protein
MAARCRSIGPLPFHLVRFAGCYDLRSGIARIRVPRRPIVPVAGIHLRDMLAQYDRRQQGVQGGKSNHGKHRGR